MLLQDWTTDALTPSYYENPPSLAPHPFMGLGKFVSGKIHQMRAAKGYLAAHASWFDESPNLTCPRCGTGQATFEHAILTCPARARVRDLLLNEVSCLGRDATTWSEPHLIRALGEYIMDPITGFPLDMIPKLFPTPFPLPPTRDSTKFPARSLFSSWLLAVLCFLICIFPCKKRLKGM